MYPRIVLGEIGLIFVIKIFEVSSRLYHASPVKPFTLGLWYTKCSDVFLRVAASPRLEQSRGWNLRIYQTQYCTLQSEQREARRKLIRDTYRDNVTRTK